MDRRGFCASVLSGCLAGLSGCGIIGRTGEDSPTESPTETPQMTTIPLARLGQPSDICKTDIIEDFNIKAIVDPAFGETWNGHDIEQKYRQTENGGDLAEDAVVIGLEAGDKARAYPLSVLWHHEIVNDVLDRPLMVTYCSICRSGFVGDRRLDGTATLFGVSGQLWKPPDRYISASADAGRSFGASRWNGSTDVSVREGPNLVMYDVRTRSYWSQAIGQAICGPLTGTRLRLVPSQVTTWAEWQANHTDTRVLLPPPHSRVDD